MTDEKPDALAAMRPARRGARKYIRGVEVYRFKDDDTFDMYLSVVTHSPR